jgi:hypothetical protein
MLRQAVLFSSILLAMALALVLLERPFSPSFQKCISWNAQGDKESASEKNPSGFAVTVVSYVQCSGAFLDRHAASIAALATIIIAAFTGTLWRATSLQASLTEDALVAGNKAFISCSGVSAYFERRDGAAHYSRRYRPNWQNSGKTPTKNFRHYTCAELRNTPLPIGFDFTQTDHASGTGFIAPKSTQQGGVGPKRLALLSVLKTSPMFSKEENISSCEDGRSTTMFSRTRPCTSQDSVFR